MFLTFLTSVPGLRRSGPLPTPDPEDDRARVLEAYGAESLLDDPELVAIARFAARLCGTPIALISLVERDRQRFLARVGIELTESPRETSFCAHAMLLEQAMEVPDATLDERFAENPFVLGEPHIRFYAGKSVVSHDGTPLGSLSVIDTVPRPGGLTDEQRDGLAVLAEAVRRRLRGQHDALAAQRDLAERERYLRVLADSIPAIAWSAAPDGTFEFFNQRMLDFTGLAEYRGGTAFHPEDWEKARVLWHHSLATGAPYEVEHRLLRHDGEYRWMISRAVPVRDAEGAIVRWFGTAVDIHELYAALEARDLLASELSHRIKNIFAVVAGLISLSARKRPEYRPFADELSGTIRALGRAHDYVRPTGHARGGKLHGLLGDLFEPYGIEAEARVRVTGDDAAVAPRAATPLALVFHELATNSAKYGALAAVEGHVELTVTDQGETLLLTWVERGSASGTESELVEGFGSRLIEMSVTGQLGGSWQRRFGPEGLIVELTVSKAAIAA